VAGNPDFPHSTAGRRRLAPQGARGGRAFRRRSCRRRMWNL
jgi:hypothetical protein